MLLVFFHSFTLKLLGNIKFILCSIFLLINHILLLARLISRDVGWLIKFALRSFIVIKQLPAPFTSILSYMFVFFTYLSRPGFILLLLPTSFLAFLDVDVIFFVKRCLHSYLSLSLDTFRMFYLLQLKF